MQALVITENSDGSAVLELEMSDEESQVFFKRGLSEVLSSCGISGVAVSEAPLELTQKDVFSAIAGHGVVCMLSELAKKELSDEV